jgi:hypothetical protein
MTLYRKTEVSECELFNTVVSEGGILWHTGLEKYIMIYDTIQDRTARIRKLNYCPFCGKTLPSSQDVVKWG